VAEPRFSGYRVVEEIGSGTVSTIFKAVQEPLGRTVAIKSLKPTIAPSSPFAAQLEREARVLSGLSHAGIVLFYDFVKTESQMYLVLEHVEGWTLAEMLKKRRSFSPEVVAAVGVEVAEALAHAHDRGVVHRDLKPANVLVGKRGEVKLIDFGIAQRERLPSADEPLAPGEHGSFGTPAYMSPEQLLGDDVDARSDLFSLGVLLYQLAAGVRPYESRDPKDRRQADRLKAAVLLRDRSPDVPRGLERVVMRLIERARDDRYASAEVVAEQLSTYLRSVTRDTRSEILRRSLVDAGLVKGGASAPAGARPSPKRRDDTRATWAGFGAIGAAFLLGVTLVEWTSWSARSGRAAGRGPLELVPPRSGSLRVVATPWAEVWVDGQRVDVTPFARPVPLTAGVHYVSLRHPEAPEESRTVRVAEGESVLVDVAMRIDGFATATDAGASARNTREGGP
jgi:serine/threonine-protein kinase